MLAAAAAFAALAGAAFAAAGTPVLGVASAPFVAAPGFPESECSAAEHAALHSACGDVQTPAASSELLLYTGSLQGLL